MLKQEPLCISLISYEHDRLIGLIYVVLDYFSFGMLFWLLMQGVSFCYLLIIFLLFIIKGYLFLLISFILFIVLCHKIMILYHIIIIFWGNYGKNIFMFVSKVIFDIDIV